MFRKYRYDILCIFVRFVFIIVAPSECFVAIYESFKLSIIVS